MFQDSRVLTSLVLAILVLIGAVAYLSVRIKRVKLREKDIERQRSEFISLASHQLRTPLTSIQWVIERILKTQKLSIQAMEYLNDIHTSAKKVSALVDLFLNVSRIESGTVGVTPQELDVVDFVKSYFSEVMPLCAKKNIVLSFSKYPPALRAITDINAFRNILQSLISNAIEYSRENGKIEIFLDKKPQTFLLTVKDNGIGIPFKEQPRVFEKFMRATNAKLIKTEGTGLGLYLARQAVELLGGRIWFESVENQGTAFYVELPIESQSKKGIKSFA